MFEVLTIGSFLMVFIRKRSKKQVRKYTERYSMHLKSPQSSQEPNTPPSALEVIDGVYWNEQDMDVKESSTNSVV